MATMGGDCDDINAAINPDAIEVCDEDDLDEDCDGVADGAGAIGAVAWYLDADNDTYGDPQNVVYHCDPHGVCVKTTWIVVPRIVRNTQVRPSIATE